MFDGRRNDVNDAAAICAAALAPDMRFIETKTIEQQDIQSIQHFVIERNAITEKAIGMNIMSFACSGSGGVGLSFV